MMDATITAQPLAEKLPRDSDGWLLCSYCGMRTELLDSSEDIYGKDYGPVYRCPIGCGWVGCHKDSAKRKPLGRIANLELRRAKQAAHVAFDALWKRKGYLLGGRRQHYREARRNGYRWLAGQLGISEDVCHIGMMSVEGCHRVIEVCKPYDRGWR
ncbi:zinc-finger-containing protein [Azospirillum melinis]|uniref:zinc-finger-containing protein n=1 Tax=Azospirillum melinis TaxID=328839 RepID=UPI003756DE67